MIVAVIKPRPPLSPPPKSSHHPRSKTWCREPIKIRRNSLQPCPRSSKAPFDWILQTCSICVVWHVKRIKNGRVGAELLIRSDFYENATSENASVKEADMKSEQEPWVKGSENVPLVYSFVTSFLYKYVQKAKRISTGCREKELNRGLKMRSSQLNRFPFRWRVVYSVKCVLSFTLRAILTTLDSILRRLIEKKKRYLQN